MNNVSLHNSMSKEVEQIKRSHELKIYSCGPTVYETQHIGNMRYFVFVDTISRILRLNSYQVRHVINITDVGHLTGDTDEGEDKIEVSAKQKGKSAQQIIDFYTDIFFRYLRLLNISKSNFIFTKASDYIDEQIQLLKIIESRGATYKISDGIYFDTSKYINYGLLGNIDTTNLEEGHRIGIQKDKKNKTDFALWKFSTTNEKRQQEWDSPWGVGFPGWHLECSAMAKAKLGDTLDIHTGGIDNMPTHHNNEIAQSETASQKQYVKIWVHCEHLNLEEEKISKSIGNTITIDELLQMNYSPLVLRYLFLISHYKSQSNFSFRALNAAETALSHINNFMITNKKITDIFCPVHKETLENINRYISDDLKTPQAIACLWDMMSNETISNSIKITTLKEADKYFGLSLGQDLTPSPGKEIIMLAERREQARMKKDYKSSDECRDKISTLGWSIEDKDRGFKLVPNRNPVD